MSFSELTEKSCEAKVFKTLNALLDAEHLVKFLFIFEIFVDSNGSFFTCTHCRNYSWSCEAKVFKTLNALLDAEHLVKFLFIFEIFVDSNGSFFTCTHCRNYSCSTGYDIATGKDARNGGCTVFISNDVTAFINFQIRSGIFN